MKSRVLSASLLVAVAMSSGCAGMMKSISEHNDRVAARQVEQGPSNAYQAPAPKPQANKKHAPYTGQVKVGLFVTFEGDLWQKGMRARAAEILRADLAAHAQFDLVPEERMKKLGKLGKPQMGSAAWASNVRSQFGKKGPQVLLHVTLKSEEAIGKNKRSGKIEKYPKFTAATSYRHVKRNASASFSKDGHVFANGNVLKEVIRDFHDRTLTEIMPAK